MHERGDESILNRSMTLQHGLQAIAVFMVLLALATTQQEEPKLEKAERPEP